MYLKALIPGGSRFDMTGQPKGEVTPEQQQDAQRKLDKWNGTK
ncbi:TPA: ProQ/FINO family protein [Morganella morganii]